MITKRGCSEVFQTNDTDVELLMHGVAHCRRMNWTNPELNVMV
jgi:hypothetical protein